MAIVDPQFTYTLPPSMVADTGLDVLTHAIESDVSVMASDFTRGNSMEAIRLVFENLYDSYSTGSHESREHMHYAATVAGMAFANAILMPHIIRYNHKKPVKRRVWAKYESFRADEDYAAIARMLKLPGETTEELVESLVLAIIKLSKDCCVELSIKAQGVSREAFDSQKEELAYLAYEDQCTTCNPKEPLIAEIMAILELAYEGV